MFQVDRISLQKVFVFFGETTWIEASYSVCFCFFTPFFLNTKPIIQLLFAPPPKKKTFFFQKRQEFFRRPTSFLVGVNFGAEVSHSQRGAVGRKPFAHLGLTVSITARLEQPDSRGGGCCCLTIDLDEKKPQVLAARSWKKSQWLFLFSDFRIVNVEDSNINNEMTNKIRYVRLFVFFGGA